MLIDDLIAALTRAIEELTRPVDAIKHQAKTVTVGHQPQRRGRARPRRSCRRCWRRARARRLSYRTLKVLADLDPAVAEVAGFTRYGIDGDPTVDHLVVDRGGISRERAEPRRRDQRLVGTKRRVASEREVLVARGPLATGAR